jgi:hypothetical protein
LIPGNRDFFRFVKWHRAVKRVPFGVQKVEIRLLMWTAKEIVQVTEAESLKWLVSITVRYTLIMDASIYYKVYKARLPVQIM